MKLGFTDVWWFPGGIGEWTAGAGHFVEVPSAVALQTMLSAAGTAVDTRSGAAFDLGHLPGARHAALADLLADPAGLLSGLDPDEPLALHGQGGPDGDLVRAASAAESAGFRLVKLFTPGFDGWVAAGLPVE